MIETSSQASDASKYSEPGFSLVDLDEEISSQPSSSTSASVATTSPQQQSASKRGTDGDSFFKTKFISSVVSNFVPPSDIESEYESETGSGGKNLDNISKEQLLELCHRLKARGVKYREKWSEVVKVYRDTMAERDKLKTVLTETQDKAIRRINELKEQCNLEQEAKRHLEENLQLSIEEKEEQIKALQTKLDVINTGELISLADDKRTEYSDRIATLEALLAKSNESLKADREHLAVLTKENEELNKYKDTAAKLEKEVEHIRKRKDSACTSFQEAKQKLHDDLESRNIIIKELKDQLEKAKVEAKKRAAELRTRTETIKSLNDKIATTVKDFEATKATLKEAATKSVELVKEEYEHKLATTTQELRAEIDRLTEEVKAGSGVANNEQEDTEELRKQCEQAQQENETLRQEVIECKQQLEQAITDLANVQADREQAVEELKEALKQSETKSEALENQNKMLAVQVTDLSQLSLEFEATRAAVNEASGKLTEMRKELDQAEKTIQQLRDEKVQAEEAFQAEINKQQQEASLKSSNEQQLADSVQELEAKVASKAERVAQLETLLVQKDTEIVELASTKSELEGEIVNMRKKMNTFDAGLDERLKMATEEHEKNLKMLADSKAVIVKLREDCQHLQAQLESVEAENRQLNDRKEQLDNEVSMLDVDLVRMKNQLMQIFYHSYAECEVKEISALNYDQFFEKIQHTYRQLIEEKQTSVEKVAVLQAELDRLNEESQQALAGEQGKHETVLRALRELNDNLVKEIKLLKTKLAKHTEMETQLEANEQELATVREKNESLQEELEDCRAKLVACRETITAKEHEMQAKDDQLYELSNKLEAKEKETRELMDTLAAKDSAGGEQQAQLVAQLERVQQEVQRHEIESRAAGEKNVQLQREIGELSKQNSTNLEEIGKLKQNAKNILESKHKLQEKLKSSEANLVGLKQEYQQLVEARARTEADRVEADKAQEEHRRRESSLLTKIGELDAQLATLNSTQAELKSRSDQLKSQQELCAELEAKLNARDELEQDLRTELIAAEERLKQFQISDHERQETMQNNEKMAKAFKEQVNKHLGEIGELKAELADTRTKHEATVDKLYKQLEVRESQLDESLLNANSQHHSTTQELLKAKTEIGKLNARLEDVIGQNKELEAKLSGDSRAVGEQHRQVVERYEYQIESLQSQLEAQKQEIATKLEQFDEQDNRLRAEHKDKLAQLTAEVAEKTMALEEVHEYYQQRLKTKETELKTLHEQLTSTDKNNYQINALQNSLLQYQ